MEVQSLEIQAKTIVMEKLIKLIEKYPNKDWNWNSISFNPEFGHENFTFNKNNYRDYYVESVEL